MNISPTGCWQCPTVEPHGFDEPLCAAILALLAENDIGQVVDLGCGSGRYVDYLCDHGIDAVGYDGNPHTGQFSSRCHVADLSGPFKLIPPVECVMSLETGEHIPREFENQFINNLTENAIDMIILSWFPYPGEGIGHVNERDNKHIEGQLNDRGFVMTGFQSDNLRSAATLWWFKKSLMVFARK